MADDKSNTGEEWRDLPGHFWYKVSSEGDVWRRPSLRWPSGKFLSQACLKGYAAVTIFNGSKPKLTYVHKLVALAFIGPRPDGMHINHKDGDKTNNHADNLEYVTPSENTRHAVALGLCATGDKHWQRKYPEQRMTGDRHPSRTHPEKFKSLRNIKPERRARGERIGGAVLTDDAVRQIRARLTAKETGASIARAFNVSESLIRAIRQGKIWKHVA